MNNTEKERQTYRERYSQRFMYPIVSDYDCPELEFVLKRPLAIRSSSSSSYATATEAATEAAETTAAATGNEID